MTWARASSSWFGTGHWSPEFIGRSPQPRESGHQQTNMQEKDVSIRFSHFIASMMLPQATVVNPGPCGTCGTHPAPPAMDCEALVMVPIAGSPFRARDELMSGVAAAKLPARM